MGGIHLNLIQLYLASGLGVVKQGLSRSTDLVKKSSHLSQKALNAALKVDGDFPTARSRIYPCSAGHSLRAEIMDCFRDYVVSERFEINQRGSRRDSVLAFVLGGEPKTSKQTTLSIPASQSREGFRD
ncbi:hypothetical protein QL285_098395 [Trifolium repens]|nr:hypothetical protein QL285_098395 [Trifolium repens]